MTLETALINLYQQYSNGLPEDILDELVEVYGVEPEIILVVWNN
jgi:hypothetical protein